MTAPVRNVPLLEETLTHIRDHPEEWDQAEWICGSAACFAGRSVLLSGARQAGSWGWCVFPGENVASVRTVARDLLGITNNEAYNLFHCDNFNDLERMVKNLCNGEAIA